MSSRVHSGADPILPGSSMETDPKQTESQKMVGAAASNPWQTSSTNTVNHDVNAPATKADLQELKDMIVSLTVEVAESIKHGIREELCEDLREEMVFASKNEVRNNINSTHQSLVAH